MWIPPRLPGVACRQLRPLIAYASGWLKFHYLPVSTAAILNNQPMGFYPAAVLVKDVQRHGLRIKPVDVLRSDWNCILEREGDESLSLRLGLRYVRGLRSTVATEIEQVRAIRPFGSIEELARRSPRQTFPRLRKQAR